MCSTSHASIRHLALLCSPCDRYLLADIGDTHPLLISRRNHVVSNRKFISNVFAPGPTSLAETISIREGGILRYPSQRPIALCRASMVVVTVSEHRPVTVLKINIVLVSLRPIPEVQDSGLANAFLVAPSNGFKLRLTWVHFERIGVST